MQSIIASLKKREFQPLYFLFGAEPYFIDSITDYMESNMLNDGEKAFNQSILYGKEISARQIIDEAIQYPMMSAYRLIIVKEAQGLKDIKLLSDYFSEPSTSTILVLAYKKEKVDKRVNWWKTLKKNAIIFESKPIYQNKIPAYIQTIVKKSNRNIGQEASLLLSEYLGTDLSKIHNEIEKLFLNIKSGEEISLDAIQDQVGISKDYNVFEFQSALGSKDYLKAFRIAQYFVDNPKQHNMVGTIGMLYRYFTKIWAAKQNIALPDAALGKKIGLFNSYFVREYRVAAEKYSADQLERNLSLLNIYDLKVKGINMRSSKENILLPELVGQLLA